MDLEERLVRLRRTGHFGWLCDYGTPGDPPPRTRRRAPLFALVFLCGEAGLDAADLAMVRRLIRIKAPRDVPYAFDACFNGWLAVRGGDQRGVVAMLGLADAAPATYQLVQTLVCHLTHGAPDRREGFAHVFMSPQLNGWTLVRGPNCDPDCPQVARWAGRLSEQYGRRRTSSAPRMTAMPGWSPRRARSPAGTAAASPGPRADRRRSRSRRLPGELDPCRASDRDSGPSSP